jgi:hypothetical protein
MSDLFDNAKKKQPYQKCCHSHPVLKLGMGEIVGASCGQPRDGYDIYIGLCHTMRFQHQDYPWNQTADPIVEFQYRITDGCAPGAPAEFKKMINWVADQLDDGKKIHVGCIGGHGRTGLFLAALVSLYEDLTDDPIKWVRENHCQKAVESESQLKFLKKHFGCKTKGHKPSKPAYSGTQSGRLYGKQSKSAIQAIIDNKPLRASDRKKSLSARDVVVDFEHPERIPHMSKKGSIWG